MTYLTGMSCSISSAWTGVFYTKVYNRLLVPLTAANQPQAPRELRTALATITRHVDHYAEQARLSRAA